MPSSSLSGVPFCRVLANRCLSVGVSVITYSSPMRKASTFQGSPSSSVLFDFVLSCVRKDIKTGQRLLPGIQFVSGWLRVKKLQHD